jgi:hypothetical protein
VNARGIKVVVCMVAASASFAACGVSAESQPKTIAPEDVPFDLSRRASRTEERRPSSGPYSYDLYFVSGDRLQAVARAAKISPTPTRTLRALLRGPHPTESDQGLRSVLDPRLVVEHVGIENGVATITLEGTGASRIATDEQAVGIAQLVYTATGIPGVHRVRFEVAGTPSEIPRGDGSLSSRPLARSDFPDVAP